MTCCLLPPTLKKGHRDPFWTHFFSRTTTCGTHTKRTVHSTRYPQPPAMPPQPGRDPERGTVGPHLDYRTGLFMWFIPLVSLCNVNFFVVNINAV